MDAAGIDAVLTRAHSPLAGQGATFVAEGVAAGIDPRLLLAIAAHETAFETNDASRVIHNPFGLGPGMAFTSDAAAISRAARTLDAYYVQEGRIRIDTIGPKWAPIGAANDPYGLNRNWIPGVSAQFTALGGDADANVLIGAQRATCPAPAAAAPAAPAPSERASGVAEITTWGGAALMIALVGYLALRRRRLETGPAPAGAARPRWAPDPDRGDDPLPDDIAMAQAQTASTTAPLLGLSDGSGDEIVEDAEWTSDDEPAGEAVPTEAGAPADDTDAPAEEPITEPVQTEAEVDPADAYWAWAEDERPEDDGPAEEPAGWWVDDEPAPAAPAPVVTAPEPDDDRVAEQAGIAADLVPALLDGLLPLERVCDRAGVTPRMLALMRVIADAPLPVAEQARRLGVSRGVVTGLCRRLEALGLAQREPLAGDARRHAVVLTAAGYELCADSAPALEPERVEVVLSRMTPAEREALLAGLTALASPSAT